jgi:microtubule-associated protein, RP/EB family
MMDAAYFTGRKELLDFFNDLLDLNLAKIEQTASGAVACQITEYIYPGSIPMSRVNWEAKSEYEYVQNYKLLQVAFKNHNIQRYVDVPKLIKAKYQDNLEFCQWLKAFFDQSGSCRQDYDPVAARAKGKGAKGVNQLLTKTSSNYNSKPIPTSAGTRRTAAAATGTAPRAAAAPRPRSVPTATITRTLQENKSRVGNSDPITDAVLADANLMKKNAELNAKVAELESMVKEIETERDFYFDKLRDVEVIVQVHQEQEEPDPATMVEKVFRILYATAEDKLTVSDDGEIVDGALGLQQQHDEELDDLLTA